MSGTSSIDGIMSGLDTTEIVNTIIDSERYEAKLLENENVLYTNTISAIKSLEAKLIALNTQLGVLAKSSTYEKYNVNVSDDSYLTAVANEGEVATGSYNLQVLSLARNHQIASQGFSEVDEAYFGNGTITIQVGDNSSATITIDESNNTLEGIKEAINDANVGVTASIINDGTSSRSYRLLLTADETGLNNQIDITSEITGGDTLNFLTGSFDSPETIDKDLASTSQLSLGSTAAYSGSENKTYTFTVRGDSTQTIGDGTIYIDWDDGTNSGTIAVTQADAEVILGGDGADGLSLSFTSGTLTGGDTFQVSTFAPLIQEASNAKIAFGSTSGGGSPITISSSDNTFEDVISGMTLTVNKVTEAGETISVNASRDIEGIKEEIYSFIEKYNEIQSFIDEQNTYDSDTQESGVLFGDSTVLSMQTSIRNVVSSVVSGISSRYNQLVGLGIRTGTAGQLSVNDASALNDALEDNLDEVIRLFTTSADSDSNSIAFVSASEDVVSGKTYDVDITQAATHGGFNGGLIDDPASSPITLDSSNNRIRLIVDGMVSDDIVLSEGTYNSYEDLIGEIQARIDADDKIGDKNVSVSWVDNGDGQGYINFESNNWGESSYVKTVGTIDDNAYLELGLYEGAYYNGLNVEGTINGEEAEGKGRILTGKEGNATTDGLVLKISITESQLKEGSEGSLSITKGVASKMYDLIERYTDSSTGIINAKVNSLEKQIEINEGRIVDIDERLELKKERLLQEYADMEVALSEYSSTSTYLEQQINNLNSNWKWNQ